MWHILGRCCLARVQRRKEDHMRQSPTKTVAIAMLLASSAVHGQTATHVWTGGPILTMDDKAMRAEAVAEAGGKIIAVGTKADVMKVKGPQTQVIDLKGRSRQDAADYRFRL
jgi:hypothetical protein